MRVRSKQQIDSMQNCLADVLRIIIYLSHCNLTYVKKMIENRKT